MKRHHIQMNLRVPFIRFCLLIGSGLGSVQGQAVIGHMPSVTTTNYSPTNPSGTAPKSAPLSSIESAFPNLGPLTQFGALAIRPRVSYGIIYGNGILRVPGEPENTTVQTFSAGSSFTVGTQLNANYTLSRQIYSSRLIVDSTNHNASLSWGFNRDDWSVRLAQSYSNVIQPFVETGGQTKQESYATMASGNYSIGPKTAVSLSLNRNVRIANPIFESTSWTGSDWIQWGFSTWVHYGISPKLRIGLGLKGGIDDISDNPDMRYTQPQAQATWTPTDRLTFNAEVGLENRKANTSDSVAQENIVYSTSAGYQLFPTTSLSIGANRNVSTAYFADQTTVSEGWSVGVQQRLLKRIYASASYGTGRTSYAPSTRLVVTNRDDRFESASVSFSTVVLTRGSVSLFFQRSRNRSNSQGFGFTTNQMGANFAYGF